MRFKWTITALLLYFFFSIEMSAQDISAGLTFSGYTTVLHAQDEKREYSDYQSFATFGEFKYRSLLVKVSCELNTRKIDIEKSGTIYSYYDSGLYPGQYYSDRVDRILLFNSIHTSILPEISIGYSKDINSRLSFVFSFGFGKVYGIKHRILKDSVIIHEEHTYSNQPAGQYSHTESTTYESAYNNLVFVTMNNAFLSPSFALRVKLFEEKLYSELRLGINYHIKELYKYEETYAMNDLYFRFSLAYTFENCFRDKATNNVFFEN